MLQCSAWDLILWDYITCIEQKPSIFPELGIYAYLENLILQVYMCVLSDFPFSFLTKIDQFGFIMVIYEDPTPPLLPGSEHKVVVGGCVDLF